MIKDEWSNVLRIAMSAAAYGERSGTRLRSPPAADLGLVGQCMKLLDCALDALSPRFTSATRVLREQLAARGVKVWLSAGCLAEFARIGAAAATRTRQADESYRASLRREMETRAGFIQEWTGSDRKFEPSQWRELVAIARMYALPRPWTGNEPSAAVSRDTTIAELPGGRLVKIVRQ